MLQEMVKVIRKGEENGNNMPIRLTLPSGVEIIGLPTENFYGGEWDLGPTWNYLLLTDRPFLVDTGKFGMGPKLLEMMESAGVSGGDVHSIIVSHGHEDHDGGLFGMVESTGAKVKAHRIYDRLIRFYPTRAPAGVNKNFPASCWHCFMPESFSSQHCLSYHQERNSLKIEQIGDGRCSIEEAIHTYHVPGHSPDALAILVGDEALIVGDTVLPQITPFPSREAFFEQVREILAPHYTRAQSIYGLRAYIRSLRKLEEIGRTFTDLLVLPGHRLFYNNHWNEIDLQLRIKELIEHHVDRCADILRILKQGAKTAREIAAEHFEQHLLKGVGVMMAENEVLGHCELLYASNDVVLAGDTAFGATGSSNFESLIQSLEAE
jgi:glyoxylase-like metal-dependent hydrolase (beta-lactamase superfamily II)